MLKAEIDILFKRDELQASFDDDRTDVVQYIPFKILFYTKIISINFLENHSKSVWLVGFREDNSECKKNAHQSR